MESRGKFRLKLTQVASELDSEKLAKLKFLCCDSIQARDLEKIKTPEQLFLELEQSKEIEPNRLELQFLNEILFLRREKTGVKPLEPGLKTDKLCPRIRR